MASSLGLSLYNLGQRVPAQVDATPPPRPDRPVVWINVPSAEGLRPARALAARLIETLGVAVVLTTPEPGPAERALIPQPPPPDLPGPARAFLEHWQPFAAILAEGELRPTLLAEARARGVAQILVEGRTPSLPRGRDGWWPGLVRATLQGVGHVLALDEVAARAFRKAGAAPDLVEVVGRMELPSAALPCLEAERAELATQLRSRPVWFAAGLPADEEAMVIAAHRAVMRLAHRLLLIVVPEDPARIEPLAEQMQGIEGWIVARRSAEEPPDPEVQVYLADSPAENGLWFRLAPVSFLGGSLGAGGCRIDPLQPAALGSAIIHGPRVGAFGPTIGRLAAAQGSALVGSAADLAETLAELQAPDRAARAAQAAWGVVSDGAEATERVVALVRAALAPAGPA